MHYTVCDFVLDITQNSIEAGSSRVELDWDESPAALDITVRDNGRGMTGEELALAMDPFHTDGRKHRHRRVGLGLPFLQQTLGESGGRLDIRSEKGRGTEVLMTFNREHIDTPPEGDRTGLFLQVLCFDGDYETVIRRLSSGKETYRVVRSELTAVLGDLRIAGSRILLRDYLDSQETEP